MMEGLQLSADEWLFAPWRPRTIQPRPPARPFSKVDAHKALRRLLRAWRTRSAWNESGITAAISREEALFWLHANFALHRYVGIAPERLEEQANARSIVSLLYFRRQLGISLTARDLHPKVIKDVLFDISQMQLQFETKS